MGQRTQACVRVGRGAVGAVAGAEGDFAEVEVVAELGPFGVGGFAVLVAGSVGAALVDEGAVVADDLVGVDGDVSLGGVEVEVAEQLGGDVDGQAGVDGLGCEDPAEVVRRVPDRGAVDVGDASVGGEFGEELVDVGGADDGQPVQG